MAALVLLAPALLMVHSFLVWRDLGAARDAYLRNLAASVAARAQMGEALMEEEPAVTAASIVRTPANETEGRVMRGEQLYALEKGETVWRLTVPVEADGERAVARIDLSASAADFLTARARQTLGVSLAAGAALLGLGAWGVAARRRQARLEQFAELGRMSAVLAHEIRNPLGTVKGFTQLAKEGAPAEIVPMLDTSLAQVERLENLVRDLLSYSRPPEPELRQVAWAEMAERIREHGRYTRNEASAALSVEDADLSFKADAGMLEQILLNLVRNGMEAASSAVRVSAEAGRIRVEDDGPGFSGKALEHAFEPFQTTKAQGTGLGLAVSKRLARALGAELTIESTAASGTCMELRWTK